MVKGQRTILFVDDDPAMRRVVRRLLAGTAWTMLDAEDATTALAIAAREAPRITVLLTDVVLPDLDGCALAARIVALHREIQVLYTSGYGPAILNRHGVIDAADRFLPKPFTTAELADKLAFAARHLPGSAP